MFAVNRWNPLEELASLHRNMDRVFGGRWTDAPTRQAAHTWMPPLEVASLDNGWLVRVALPGIDPNTVRIDLQGHTLTIAGERPTTSAPKTDSYQSEFSYGPFERTITLPPNVNGDKVEATCRHGMLELTVPIAESAKPRRIAIGGGTLEDIGVKKLA